MTERLSDGTSGRAGSSTSSRLVSSSSRSASGRIWPGVSPLRTADEKKRNSAASPVTRPNVRPSINCSVPSCIRCPAIPGFRPPVKALCVVPQGTG